MHASCQSAGNPRTFPHPALLYRGACREVLNAEILSPDVTEPAAVPLPAAAGSLPQPQQPAVPNLPLPPAAAHMAGGPGPAASAVASSVGSASPAAHMAAAAGGGTTGAAVLHQAKVSVSQKVMGSGNLYLGIGQVRPLACEAGVGSHSPPTTAKNATLAQLPCGAACSSPRLPAHLLRRSPGGSGRTRCRLSPSPPSPPQVLCTPGDLPALRALSWPSELVIAKTLAMAAAKSFLATRSGSRIRRMRLKINHFASPEAQARPACAHEAHPAPPAFRSHHWMQSGGERMQSTLPHFPKKAPAGRRTPSAPSPIPSRRLPLVTPHPCRTSRSGC